MTSDMELVVGCDGGVRCIYDEALDLREIGKLQITRASHVEPDAEGYWFADMGPVDGPVLGPFRSRTEALGAERGWLTATAAHTPRSLLGEVERQGALAKKPQSGLTKHPPQ
jgi:hypothetical protein